MVRVGNNEVLKTLMKTLTFVNADANINAAAKGSIIALCECCSGELIKPDQTSLLGMDSPKHYGRRVHLS